MERLQVKSFGPIENADVTFGDLTLLVGPQASGKSVFLQLLKLLIDKNHIQKTVERFGFVWENINVLNLFFGEKMARIWTASSKIYIDNTSHLYEMNDLFSVGDSNDTVEQLFYIPAQRILSVADGRPKNFMEFDLSAPYVLRRFSEEIRNSIFYQIGSRIFPTVLPNENKTIQKFFSETIFHNAKIDVEEHAGQKKFRMHIDDMNIPFMTWSTGQKEFLPLLLAFYELGSNFEVGQKLQECNISNNQYKYIVIEEPEMGLHPQAIKSVILKVIDLLSQGYQVIISTHSPVFLEFAWAFNLLKNNNPSNNAFLYELFDLDVADPSNQFLDNILSEKTINTYFFARTNGKVNSKDISSLDANSNDADITEWGGISQFAGQVTDIVSKYLN